MHLFIMNKVTTVKMEVWKISPKVSNGEKVYSEHCISHRQINLEMVASAHVSETGLNEIIRGA